MSNSPTTNSETSALPSLGSSFPNFTPMYLPPLFSQRSSRSEATLFIVVAVLVNTALEVCVAHDSFGRGFGDILAFTHYDVYGLIAITLVGPMIASCVHLFYAWRIVTLARRAWPVAVLIVAASLAHWGATFAGGIIAYLRSIHQVSPPLPVLKYQVYISLVGQATADILITGAMVFLLRKQSTKVARTRSTINSLIILIVETNLVSTLLILTGIILYRTSPVRSSALN
ncbi:unnamed protein product [Mycena citricolor]|uniref:DUF6534 domain-containing protein n=1 Tax=Mycena citricolor TaxID=2018698 RepID=A0AAD2H7W1_9AGAR|nr:unnamed protein product [Mycena citricolor]CAK5270107.1 unnamed protein product [Mycena citricolor]